MYSTIGGKFTYGTRITYSFVPDGTNLGGPTSNLFSTMDARLGRAAWQAAFTAAAATWEASANINLVQVSDNGAPLGSPGDQQGDADFGDIRIAGYNQGSSTLAWAFSPPPLNGGTLAGDMLFNTNLLWQVNRDFDLQSVAIHEFGHSLGLGHSSVSTADMFAFYNGVQQSLTTDDVNGIRSIWGPRAADWTSTGGGNATSGTAFNPMPYMNPTNNQVILQNLSINSSTDAHWYKIVTPANASGTLTAAMQSTGLSLLSPRVQIYNASASGIVQVSAPNSYGSVVTASVTNVTPNTTYYIRTLAANSGPSSAGAYALLINMGSSPMYGVSPPNTTVASQPDQGGGSWNESGKDRPKKVRRGHSDDISEDGPVLMTLGTLTGYGDMLEAPRKKIKIVRHVVGFAHPKVVSAAFAGRHKFGSIRARGSLGA